ncbi:MAG TPA: DUF3999 family protein, partial [Desulfosarcina sp.]|nr:DUF3999 family protein [Desulfosarcina sp.]
MNEIRRRLIGMLTGLCLLLGSAAAAAPPEPGDFAYGFSLAPHSDASICRFVLPADIYRNVFRQDLGDIRVFNQAGRLLPHVIQKPPMRTEKDTDRRAVPFFPVTGPDARPDTPASVHIRTDSAGAIVSVHPRTAPATPQDITAHILDLSGFDRYPDALEIAWRQADDRYVARVTLAGSNDLDHWRTLVAGISLARLRYQNHTLSQNRISLPPGAARYLRLTWNEDSPPLRITSVTGLFFRRMEMAERVFIKIGAEAASGGGVYAFDLGGCFPTDTVNLIRQEPRTLIQGTLASRKSRHGSWETRLQGVFFNLELDAEPWRSPPVRISPVQD